MDKFERDRVERLMWNKNKDGQRENNIIFLTLRKQSRWEKGLARKGKCP